MGVRARIRKALHHSEPDAATSDCEPAPNHPSLRWGSKSPPIPCVVSEGYHEAGFAAAVGPPRAIGYLEAVGARLVREPDTRYDRNIVRVEIADIPVGQLARDVSAEIAPQMDRSKLVWCVVEGIVRDGTSAASPRGRRPHHLALWFDHSQEPRGFAFVTNAPATARWPPRAWEGQPPCVRCNQLAWIRETQMERFACDRCGHHWTR